MILDVQSVLGAKLRDLVRERLGVALDAVEFKYPPETALGDLAVTIAFDLARRLRRNPREIAGDLVRLCTGLPGVSKAEAAGGGYVNLFLERGAFLRAYHGLLSGAAEVPDRQGRIIVEHTSINPNKSAHIGHLRNAVLGDTFVRILRRRGHSVGVQNYIDDTGVQVADVVVGFLHLEAKGLEEVRGIGGKFDDHCWDLYARVGQHYQEHPEARALQAQALQAIEHGDNDAAQLAEHVAARIVDCHLNTMERLGIRYDLIAHESDILRLRFWERAFELLKQSGAIRHEAAGKNAGCWVLSMDQNPGPEAEARRLDEDKIIVRSNGTVTYTGKDIAYQLWKLGILDRDFRYRRHRTYEDGYVLWSTTSGHGEDGAPPHVHAARVYNVIDVGQSYPQRVVKAAVAALGQREDAEGSRHLAYEKVVLSPATARALGYAVTEDETAVKVSGRQGLGVKANDLLDALVDKARAEIAARDPARPEPERERTAREVATGAIRYFLLRFGRAKIIVFDMDEALAFVGETGPYVQNGVVRARSIFAKLRSEGHDVEALVASALSSDVESWLQTDEGDEVWALLSLMARSDEIAEQAIEAEETSLVAKHTFAVAQAFHSYYQKPKHSVLYAETDDLRAGRTLVVDAFVRQMEVLLVLLGIPLPDRM
jgi:arginyl-tRNA synthetase